MQVLNKEKYPGTPCNILKKDHGKPGNRTPGHPVVNKYKYPGTDWVVHSKKVTSCNTKLNKRHPVDRISGRPVALTSPEYYARWIQFKLEEQLFLYICILR